MTIILGSSSSDVTATGRKVATVAGKGLVPVGRTSAQIAFQGLRSGESGLEGTDTMASFEVRIPIAVDCHSIHLVYAGYRCAVPSIVPMDNAFSMKLSALIDGGLEERRIRVPWANGSRTLVIEPGDIPVAGPIEWNFSAGDTLKLRAFVEVETLGDTWLANWYGSAVMAVDRTDSGSMPDPNGLFALWPLAVLGIPTGDAPSIAIFGDSIGQGGGNSTGWWTDGFGSTVSIVNTAVQTDAGGLFLGNSDQYALRTAIGAHCLNAVWQYGHNDVSNLGLSANTLIDNLLKWAIAMQARDTAAFATTITPKSTSTDSWATVENQTPVSAFHTVVMAYNSWLRDGSPVNSDLTRAAVGASGAGIIRAGDSDTHPLAYYACPASPGCTYPGYFDLADAVESARNSGVFKAGYSADGTHVLYTGFAALSAALSTTPLKS